MNNPIVLTPLLSLFKLSKKIKKISWLGQYFPIFGDILPIYHDIFKIGNNHDFLQAIISPSWKNHNISQCQKYYPNVCGTARNYVCWVKSSRDLVFLFERLEILFNGCCGSVKEFGLMVEFRSRCYPFQCHECRYSGISKIQGFGKSVQNNKCILAIQW